jgi:hypothetical protein
MKKFALLFLAFLSITNIASAADEIKCKLVIDNVGKLAPLDTEASREGNSVFVVEHGEYTLMASVDTARLSTPIQPYVLVIVYKKSQEGSLSEVLRAYGDMHAQGIDAATGKKIGYIFNASINYFAVEAVCARLDEGETDYRGRFLGGLIK